MQCPEIFPRLIIVVVFIITSAFLPTDDHVSARAGRRRSRHGENKPPTAAKRERLPPRPDTKEPDAELRICAPDLIDSSCFCFCFLIKLKCHVDDDIVNLTICPKSFIRFKMSQRSSSAPLNDLFCSSHHRWPFLQKPTCAKLIRWDIFGI